MISHIIDPISFEHNGREVDSTDDLLARIGIINERLRKETVTENLSTDVECGETVVENLSKEDVTVDVQANDDRKSLNEKKEYLAGDIRGFGVVGRKTVDSAHRDNKQRIKDCIKRLRESRVKDSLLPNISDRMKAGHLLDVLEEGEVVKLPGSRDEQRRRRLKQRCSGVSVVGSDVVSLFPSLKDIETARLARHAVLGSKVKFENVDMQKALRYLYIVGGSELISKAGLARHCPA